jgi:hypothetical protein
MTMDSRSCALPKNIGHVEGVNAGVGRVEGRANSPAWVTPQWLLGSVLVGEEYGYE